MMRRTRLVFAPQDPQAPPAYLLVDEFGEPVGRGEQPVLAETPAVPTTVVLVVPGTEAVARWLHLPTRSDPQARAAAALLLAEETAVEEPMHLALGALEPDGRRLVVAVAEARMRAWLDLARTYGLAPDAVVPDHLLLPEPQDEGPLAVAIGGTLAVRRPRLAFACEPGLAPVLLDGRAPQVADGEAAERLLAEGAGRLPLDLRQGDFAPADRTPPARRDLLRAAVLAGVLLLSPAVLDAAQAVRLNLAAGRLERAATQQAAAVLPRGATVSDPAAQAQAVLQRAELAAGGGPAGVAARLFAALAEIDQAQAESLIVSPDGALRATVSHTNYSDMELLGRALQGAGVAFRQEGAREEGGRIVSDIILGARP
ncbi:type II secretion system protein GspL [Phenylobacterium sp.]|uniref:type II secretion system protein GspL n=1 Tax=Phenylobacterium sp. TaxID=1871053 RepID=UPI002C364D1F|nr:type II secretion system protein GspL [Phenylobacterium sp.]HVI34458.1 type II secretion system protein GspL [Phenylobacterium sp.]